MYEKVNTYHLLVCIVILPKLFAPHGFERQLSIPWHTEEAGNHKKSMLDTTAAEGSAAHDRTVTEVSMEATGGAGLGAKHPGARRKPPEHGLGGPGVARVARAGGPAVWGRAPCAPGPLQETTGYRTMQKRQAGKYPAVRPCTGRARWRSTC